MGGTDEDCPSDQTFTIPVLSVKDKAPTINGCPLPFPVGISRTIILNASLLYDPRGTDDPTEVASYTWSISSGGTGWTFTTTNAPGVLRKTATFVTDNCNGATITVRATDHCGNQSAIGTCSILRYVETPSITGAPPYVICCKQAPFALSATQGTAGLSGYTYTWNYGTWTGISAGNAAIVTPDGFSPGNITVTANACGTTSNPEKINIPLKIIEPNTKVEGDKFLCDGETASYKLNITQEPCATITWAVTPSGAVTSPSGTGSIASITPTSGYNGSATITFTVNTPCGSESRSLNIHVGKPVISIVGFDGNLGGGIYNKICSELASHSFRIRIDGDFDNCADTWDDHGSTATNYSTCNAYDFTLKYVNGVPQCAFITVSASNECGSVNQSFIFCPSPWACDKWYYEFSISPNPSTGPVEISLQLDKDGIKEQVPFEKLEIIDEFGSIKRTISAKELTIYEDLSNLPRGKYYAQTFINGGFAVTPFVIFH